MSSTPLKFYVWTKKNDEKIRNFFFLVTGIYPKASPDKRKRRFMFSTDMLRPIEIDVLRAGNYKNLRILDEAPKNWLNHSETDIIGCVDFVTHLPNPKKHNGKLVRVDKQEKFFQLKDRKGLYRSDGSKWKREGSIPRKRKNKV